MDTVMVAGIVVIVCAVNTAVACWQHNINAALGWIVAILGQIQIIAMALGV